MAGMAASGPHSLFDIEAADGEARQAVVAMAEALAATVRTARALARDGARIDLTGLDCLIGLLSARALDLRPDHARSLQPRLLDLLAELDGLSAALLPAALN